MSFNEPKKCQSCGMLIGPSGVCMACAKPGASKREIGRTTKRIVWGVLGSLGGIAGVVLVAWLLTEGWEAVKPPIVGKVEPAWRAHTCKTDLQTALTRNFPRLDATVEKCQPFGEGAVLCFVRALENGEYKTRPVEWNCKAEDLPFR